MKFFSIKGKYEKLNFDPTFNYGNEDLKNYDNLIRYKFSQLIINLILLSSSSTQQILFFGIGNACNEMAIDFDLYFTQEKESYLERGLLTLDSVDKLKELDKLFCEKSEDKNHEFWDDDNLKSNSNWKLVREKSNEILKMLNFDNLTLELDRNNNFRMDNGNVNLIGQTDKIQIVKKKINN
ncbi:MAG: hypothetical protein IAE65_08000 [Ignavibacteria bacterium]|nr:hypothetical protein [Ignavibacteria bacterium]